MGWVLFTSRQESHDLSSGGRDYTSVIVFDGGAQRDRAWSGERPHHCGRQ